VGEENGQAYLVMEHLTGETLAERLKKGPLPLPLALDVATQIADALAASHKQGVVHRDLKPGNVMLTKTGSKLLDFGLARLTGHVERPVVEELTSAPTESAPLTGRGTILGTLPYMAPEQLEGKPADARTDIWALGAIVYEMLAGRKPFVGDSPLAVLRKHCTEDPIPLGGVAPKVPRELETIVMRLLRKDPAARQASAEILLQEFREYLNRAA